MQYIHWLVLCVIIKVTFINCTNLQMYFFMQNISAILLLEERLCAYSNH